MYKRQRLLGAKPDTIDRAEDRQLFKDTMEKLGEPVIPSKVVESLDVYKRQPFMWTSGTGKRSSPGRSEP